MKTFLFPKSTGIMETAFRNRAAAVLICILPLAVVSCSVKEERGSCPFELTVSLSLSDRPPAQRDSLEVTVCNDVCDRTACIRFSEDDRGWHSFDLEKGHFRVCGIFNRVNQRLDIPSRSVRIPQGMQSDSIYAFSYDFVFEKEKMMLYPKLYKQWATAIIIAGEWGGESSFFEEYDVRVVSDTDGFDIETLGGVVGKFEYALHSVSDRAAVRLPRQCGDNLVLEIRERVTGAEVFRYSLSERLAEIGYDWSAPDLGDICLIVSEPSDCTFVLEVKQWDVRDMGEIRL